MKQWLKRLFIRFVQKQERQDALSEIEPVVVALQERVENLEALSLLILQDFFSALDISSDLTPPQKLSMTEEEKGTLNPIYCKGNDTIH